MFVTVRGFGSIGDKYALPTCGGFFNIFHPVSAECYHLLPMYFAWGNCEGLLKVDVPILPCVFYTFNWLTLTSEMYFVRFHPEVTSCLLSRGKTKYATLGMRKWCKYIRNYLLVYQLISHFLPYLRNYKEFDGEISDLQLEKYWLSFETKKYTTSVWARGDENVIGIRAFKYHNFTVSSQVLS